MDNLDPRKFDEETDSILQIIHSSSEQRSAEEQARFDVAMEAAAADYQQHRRKVRRRFHNLNQVGLILTGMSLAATAYLCLVNSGWYSLVGMLVSCSFWAFSRWCLRKSRTRREVA